MSKPLRPARKRPGAEELSGSLPAARPLGRHLIPVLGIVIAAMAVAALGWKTTANQRLSNLEYRRSADFSETFLMLNKSRPNRGYVVGRRGSTIRRSRSSLPGSMRDIERFAFGGGEWPDHWIVRSKRYGTDLFVPVEAMPDWTYPFLYDFVHRREPELQLPSAVWTHLHVNRVYQGLYFRLSLPLDPRRKDGGSGVRRELLLVESDEMATLDTRFDPATRLYAGLLADGIFPEVEPPSRALAWLAARCPGPETALLLHNEPPWPLRVVPLPFSVRRFAAAYRGRPFDPVLDGRFRRWVDAATADAAEEPPFTAATLDSMKAEFEQYAETFRVALSAHRLLRTASRHDAPLTETRDDATADLGLRLAAN